MGKRTVQVDDADIAAAEKRIEQDLDAEVQKRLAQETTPRMDAEAKARIEQAEKKANAAATEAAETKKRLEELERCKAEQDAAAKARVEEDAKETLRRATALAEARVPKDRVESEAKRLAGMGRAAVDELLQLTPAPSADPLLSAMRREQAAGAQPAAHFVRRHEELPDGTTVPAFTVTDWRKHGAEAPAGHKTARITEAMR